MDKFPRSAESSSSETLQLFDIYGHESTRPFVNECQLRIKFVLECRVSCVEWVDNGQPFSFLMCGKPLSDVNTVINQQT